MDDGYEGQHRDFEVDQAIAALEERITFLEGSLERAFKCIDGLMNITEKLEANTRRSFDALKPSPYDPAAMKRAREK